MDCSLTGGGGSSKKPGVLGFDLGDGEIGRIAQIRSRPPIIWQSPAMLLSQRKGDDLFVEHTIDGSTVRVYFDPSGWSALPAAIHEG